MPLWGWLALRTEIGVRLWGLQVVARALRTVWPEQAVWLLRKYGASIGQEPDINPPLVIHYALGDFSHLTIGSGCHLGKEVLLDLCDRVTIGAETTVSMRVMILTHLDVGRSPLKRAAFPRRQAPVTIGAGSYLGAGAIILPGVTVGKFAVVGAGAVVTRDVPERAVVAGVPAHVLRTIGPEQVRG